MWAAFLYFSFLTKLVYGCIECHYLAYCAASFCIRVMTEDRIKQQDFDGTLQYPISNY